MPNEDKTGLVLSHDIGEHVRVLRLNRPAQRNALNAATIIELARHLQVAQADEAIRCIVLAGDEKVFSAGADIKEMEKDGFAAINAPARQAAWDAITRFPKPLIAAVDGLAYGGGHELVLLCDIVIAGEGARFAQPEINIGIIPGDGATQRLTRIVGKGKAMRIMLTGEPIDASTALALGLVTEVAPAGGAVEAALTLAGRIAQKPPVAARLVKEAVLAAYETHLHTGLAVERQAIRLAFTTEDQSEGMAAFIGKRPPVFKGR